MHKEQQIKAAQTTITCNINVKVITQNQKKTKQQKNRKNTLKFTLTCGSTLKAK